MLFVQTAGSPAVGPRVGLVAAAYVFLIDGNRQGDAHRPGLDRPSARVAHSKICAYYWLAPFLSLIGMWHVLRPPVLHVKFPSGDRSL